MWEALLPDLLDAARDSVGTTTAAGAVGAHRAEADLLRCHLRGDLCKRELDRGRGREGNRADVVGMRWRAGRALAAVTATALAGLSIVVVAPIEALPPAPRRWPGDRRPPMRFKVETRTTYTLDPAGGAVHVVHDATLTNQKPSNRSASYITAYYLPEYPVLVLSEATNLAATEGGGALPVNLEGTENHGSRSPRSTCSQISSTDDAVVPAQLRPAAKAPRSDAFTRLNAAYATFPALALGDPGLTTVEVVVPDGFEVELVGDDMRESERDGNQVFTAADIRTRMRGSARVHRATTTS